MKRPDARALKWKVLHVTALLTSLGMAGCAHVSAPATPMAGHTYEKPLDEHTYQLRAQCHEGTTAAACRDFALLRSAVLTLQKGFPQFAVLEESTDVTRTSRHFAGDPLNPPEQAEPVTVDHATTQLTIAWLADRPANAKNVYEARTLATTLRRKYALD